MTGMAARLKELAGLLVLVIFGTLVGDLLVGLFLLLRPSVPEISEGLPDIHPAVAAHPYKSYILRPGYDYEMAGIGTVVNEFGHQVLPVDLSIHRRAKEPGEIRVLFLGGSTTFQAWPFLLQVALENKGHSDFRVINAGTGGYTSQENMIDLSICGFAYSPDLVIAYLPVNDIYWASTYSDFRRDYTHMRTPLRLSLKSAPKRPPHPNAVYPFFYQMVELFRYRRELETYHKAIDLNSHTMHEPMPLTMEHANGRVSLDETIEAVIDNILSMNAMCVAHDVSFVLVTQKLFSTHNAFYTGMDKKTYEAIEVIKDSALLRGLHILEMGDAFPDSFSAEAETLVRTAFPGKDLEFNQPMAYDSMHFNPTALHLFAAILANYLIDEGMLTQ